MIYKLHSLIYSTKPIGDFYHFKFRNFVWSKFHQLLAAMIITWIFPLRELFSDILEPIFKNHRWFIFHKPVLLLYSATKTRDFYHICFWSWKWSKVHPFHADDGKYHHHLPLSEGFSLVSEDRFLKIIDDSYTRFFVRLSKTNQRFPTSFV